MCTEWFIGRFYSSPYHVVDTVFLIILQDSTVWSDVPKAVIKSIFVEETSVVSSPFQFRSRSNLNLASLGPMVTCLIHFSTNVSPKFLFPSKSPKLKSMIIGSWFLHHDILAVDLLCYGLMVLHTYTLLSYEPYGMS